MCSVGEFQANALGAVLFNRQCVNHALLSIINVIGLFFVGAGTWLGSFFDFLCVAFALLTSRFASYGFPALHGENNVVLPALKY